MTHNPRTVFILRSVARVIVPPQLPRSAVSFGLITRIDGQSFHLLWQWSGKYMRYDLQVVRDDDVRVLRRTVFTDDPGAPIRNWNLRNPDAPDAMFAVIDTTGERRGLLPMDLGVTHHPFVFLGEVVKA